MEHDLHAGGCPGSRLMQFDKAKEENPRQTYHNTSSDSAMNTGTVEKPVFCGNCGAKNERGTKFCGSCGSPM